MARPRIAVFSGPTATIGNSPPLVTSNLARRKHGLPEVTAPDGGALRFDTLRAQRLAAPVTVYVEAYTAHPLEKDAAELYAAPDGWLDASGTFTDSQPAEGGTPVHVVTIAPEDGLYPLPYMARQADGSAWDDATTVPFASAERSRQTFYPDASRIYEEIDRLGVGGDGNPVLLSNVAAFDFYRAAPPGGYTKGLAGAERTDTGAGDIEPEALGEDYYVYYPHHLGREPTLHALVRATNMVQSTLATGDYVGAQWLEGSPTTEESMYWFGLVIDTTVPLVGHSAQRPHQTASADGDRNLVDGVKFITSGVALDGDGRNRLGSMMIVDELVYSAREVTKVDARPGGYEVAGGHGGIVADMGGYGPPQVTYLPNRKHTYCSDVRLSALPTTVPGTTGSVHGELSTVDVTVKNDDGELLASAIPMVTITKYSRYSPFETGPKGGADPMGEVEILARIAENLAKSPLAGFVTEGMSPYGSANPTTNAALQVGIFSGMPVVRCGRGNTGGMAYKQDPLFIAGNNLTSTKARMLLMAALLKVGALPPAADPFNPTEAEIAASTAVVKQYQEIFDTH